jgi:aquaporin-4
MLLTLYACSIGLPIAERGGVPSINGCLGGGLTLATLVWCLGNVSGGHLNPAVTVAFLLTGKINPVLTLLYIGSQCFGAFTGAKILISIVPEYARGSLSVTQVHPDVDLVQAYFIELIITFILVFAIFSCVDSRRNDLHGSFPLQIGSAVVVGGLFGGKFTGGSMNPARSFGPALVMNIWTHHSIYWLGPISGSILAGLIYQTITLKCVRKPIRRPYTKA